MNVSDINVVLSSYFINKKDSGVRYNMINGEKRTAVKFKFLIIKLLVC